MQEVTTPAAVDDVISFSKRLREVIMGIIQVVRAKFERSQIDGLFQLTCYIYGSLLNFARCGNIVRIDLLDSVERLGQSGIIGIVLLGVTAGVNPSIIANHTIGAGSAGNPVVAITADEIFILALTKEDVTALGAVYEVITGFTVNLIGCANIIIRRMISWIDSRQVIQAAKIIIK